MAHEHVHGPNCNHDHDHEDEDFDPIPVHEIMTTDVVCATPETTVVDIAISMRENDCGSIPIIADSASMRLVGIVTDRDLAVRVVAEGTNPSELTVADVMTESPVTVGPDSDLEDCLDLMEENQLRRIVVVDEDNSVVGIIAQADIAEWASEQEAAEFLQEVSEPDEDNDRQ